MHTRPRPPAAALALLALVACSEGGDVSDPFGFPIALDLVEAPVAFCGTATTATLIADGVVPVGTVEVVNDEHDLYVTYRTDDAWPIRKTALFVGTSVAGIPTSGGGNPRVGQFPYKANHRAGPYEVTWRVPLGEAGPEIAVIAAFAEVGADPEGAWADGPLITEGGSWATYFTHSIRSCGTLIDPDEGGTVTFGEIVELVIPPLSLAAPTVITIEPASSSHAQAIAGTVFDFGPDGLEFAPPALLTIEYDPAMLPAGVPEGAIRPFLLNGIFDLLPVSAHDTDANTITFEVEHFSIYGLGYLAADLALEVTATPNPARLSDDVAIDFVVHNTGSPLALVENAEVMITFSGLPFIRDFLPPICTTDGQLGPNGEIVVSCATGPLGPGESLEFEITGSPFTGLGAGTMLVEALILPVEPTAYYDTNPGNGAVALPIQVFPDVSADLRMKAFGPGPPRQAGLERTVSATVESLDTSLDVVDATIQFLFGDAGAIGLEVLFDQLPAGCSTTQVSASTTINCAVGPLAPGEEAMRQVVVRPLQARFYNVSATGFPTAGDPTPANNTQSGGFEATATVADLAVAIVANKADIDVGETVLFSAQVQHLGGDLLPGGALRLEIEGGATLVEAGTGCDVIDVFPFPVALNCSLQQIEPGQNSATYSVSVQGTTGGTDLIGHARLLMPDYVQDSDASNDTDEITVPVLPDNLVDYQLDPLTVSATTVKPFQNITYTGFPELLTASATPVAGGSYVINLQGDIDVESISEPTCSVSALLFNAGYEMTCPLVSMVAGEVKAFGITVSPNSAPGAIDVTASVVPPAGTQEESPADNAQATQTTVDPLVADVNLSLIGDTPDPVDAGDVITYEVFAQSATGSDDLPLVTVRLLAFGDIELVSLPTGIDMTCQSVDSNLADVVVLCDIANHEWQNARPLTWQIRALSGSVVRVEAEIFPVASYTSDPDPSNNLRTQQTTVNAAAPEPTGTLLFSSDRASSLEQLYTKDLATGTVTRIVDSPTLLEGRWSPDGSRFVAMWGSRLAIGNADGSDVVLYDLLALFDVGAGGSPDWSPDGSKIVLHGVYDFDSGEDHELWIFDVAAETLSRLTDNAVDDEFPAWSPGVGASIAYTVDRTALYTIDPAGTNALPMLSATSVLHPDWSPDGARIAFTQLEATGSSIAVMDVGDAGSLATLVNDGRNNEKPAWSPDGLFLAFSRSQLDNDDFFDLYFILADGTGSALVLDAVIDFNTTDVDWK